MEVIETYRTADGKTFTNKSKAEQHEALLNSEEFQVFEVKWGPDLNEGRVPFYNKKYLLVHAKSHHELFAEHWCFKRFGTSVEFVMGVYGSNAICRNWVCKRVDKRPEQIPSDDVIDRIEEKFVKHIWD